MVATVVSNMAHDLRTALVPIRGYTRMILEERAGPLSSEQREYLTVISENTRRAIHLVQSLVRFTIEQPLSFQAVDLRDLCRECVLQIQPQALKKSVQIREKTPFQPVWTLGDPGRLTEAFLGLLSGAVEFTAPDGEIVLELSVKGADEVMIKILGGGAGLPPEFVETVQNPSAGAGTSGTEKRDEQAARLFLLHDILRSHGGRISATAESGAGFALLVRLPAERSEKS